MLSLDAEQIAFIIVKLREYRGSAPAFDDEVIVHQGDGDTVDVIDPEGDDTPGYELRAFLDALNDDQKIDLAALAWMGRDTTGTSLWSDVRAQATAAHNARTADYLLGMPLVADYLEEGLSEKDADLLDRVERIVATHLGGE